MTKKGTQQLMKVSSSVFAIFTTLAAAIFGYGKLYANQMNTAEEVVKIEAEVKEVKTDVTENTAVNREQAIILQRTVQILDRLEQRM